MTARSASCGGAHEHRFVVGIDASVAAWVAHLKQQQKQAPPEEPGGDYAALAAAVEWLYYILFTEEGLWEPGSRTPWTVPMGFDVSNVVPNPPSPDAIKRSLMDVLFGDLGWAVLIRDGQSSLAGEIIALKKFLIGPVMSDLPTFDRTGLYQLVFGGGLGDLGQPGQSILDYVRALQGRR